MSTNVAGVQGSKGAGKRFARAVPPQSDVHPCSPAPVLPGPSDARLRQALYRFFGAIFLYPDAERLKTLRTAAEALQQERDAWKAHAFSGPLDGLLQVLMALSEGANLSIETEYTRLFSVKPAAPPYESFFLDPQRQVAGWIAVQLENEYARAGLALAPSLTEPPDHAAVELEFMAYLCGQEAQGWESRAIEDGFHAQDRQSVFLARHLGRWFPRFARQVEAAAVPGQLYYAVIEAAKAFMRCELAHRIVPAPTSRPVVDQSTHKWPRPSSTPR